MDISYDFTDRVAVVTGGANGIGADIAKHLRLAGAHALFGIKDKAMWLMISILR
jgi:NAD(P)-dependent dehydrogenase (short-subunit alcohol dehydrogenase family)